MDKKPVAAHSESVKPKRRALSYLFTAGVFMSLLDKLTSAIYNAFSGGLFGKIFTAYSSEQSALEKGYLRDHVFGDGNVGKYSRKIRGAISERIENGVAIWLLGRVGEYFMSMPLKLYGNYLVFFGLYGSIAYFVRNYTSFFEPADYSMIGFLAVIIVSSIPLMLSKESMGRAIGSSRSARAVFIGVFGFREELFEIPARNTKFRATSALVLGFVCGLLTLFVHPISIALAAVFLVVVTLIMIVPEIGVLLSLFALPFLSFTDNPSAILGIITILSSASTVVKLIRGKRIIKIELIDIFVVMFAAMLFMSGAVSAGGSASFGEVIMCCTLLVIYFLIANMMRTRLWIKRCVIALVASATLVAILGVLEYFFAELSTEWIDTVYFSDIRGRVVSLFDNSNVLAFYLAMIFPFALDLMLRCRKRKERFLTQLSCVAMILCIVFTFSRGAWIAVIISTATYLFIRTRKTLKIFIACLFAIPILPLVLPSSIINRFLSIGDMADSSTFYRVYTWRGSFRAISDHLFGGIGYGNAAFKAVYPSYAYAGIESAEHTHSLYLQILLGMGIVGLIVFGLMLFMFVQKSLGYIRSPESHRSACYVAAGLSSVVAALTMGLFDHIWYNYRVFFLFWAVMGIAVATVRVGQTALERRNVGTVYDGTSADIDIFLG